ncbi:ATP-binding protein [Dactylosporangium sp. CA-152071]|uniref:ATP-binding protein n=1 Tax=Dactylosporangium sp. CA-152071 TaxID=3239933 RepID=UPI003D92B3CF
MIGSRVGLRSDIEQGTVEVIVEGPCDGRVKTDLATAVRKGLAEHPRALLLNLTAVEQPNPALVGAVLLAERHSGSIQPPVPLVLVASDATWRKLVGAGLMTRIPIYTTMAAAQDALSHRTPPFGRVRLDLQPEAMAPSTARSFIGDTVLAWDLRALLHPARAIISELVTNAVQHARTPFTVTASRRWDLLHLAVEDGDPALPRMIRPVQREDVPLDVRGIGLGIVARSARAWGATRTVAGKVIWATLATVPTQRRT